MLAKSLGLVLGAAAAVEALVPRGACNANNCLRALRAASPTTRLAQAQADCAAFFGAQSPPPAPVFVTMTSWSTVASTSTSVSEITATSTVEQVDVSVVTETPTTSVGPSATITVTVNPGTLAGRQASGLPVYASACTDLVRYSSACSCIGVTEGPSVAPVTSTLTVVLPVTSAAVETRITTVTTVDVTEIVSTTTQTTTVDATTVGGGVATITTIAQSITGMLWIEMPGTGSVPVDIYESSNIAYLKSNPDSTVTRFFELRPDGTLWYGNRVAKGNPNNSGQNPLQFFFVTPETATATREPFKCSLTNGLLSCVVGQPQVPLRFGVGSSNFIYSGSEALIASSRILVDIRLS